MASIVPIFMYRLLYKSLATTEKPHCGIKPKPAPTTVAYFPFVYLTNCFDVLTFSSTNSITIYKIIRKGKTFNESSKACNKECNITKIVYPFF